MFCHLQSLPCIGCRRLNFVEYLMQWLNINMRVYVYISNMLLYTSISLYANCNQLFEWCFVQVAFDLFFLQKANFAVILLLY